MVAKTVSDTITAAELLGRLDRGPAPFTAEGLGAIERAKTEQREPEDKWTGHHAKPMQCKGTW